MSAIMSFTSAICLTAVVAWLVVLLRQRDGASLRPLGVFLLLPVVALLFFACTVRSAEAAPLIPALGRAGFPSTSRTPRSRRGSCS